MTKYRHIIAPAVAIFVILLIVLTFLFCKKPESQAQTKEQKNTSYLQK